MAKPRASDGKKRNGIVSLKVVIGKLQRSLLIGKKTTSSVPSDVKEGHFVVIAMDDYNKPQRFVVSLSYLNHPIFLTLLERAAEEYGFDHHGALTLPCRPTELERLLAHQQWEDEEGEEEGRLY